MRKKALIDLLSKHADALIQWEDPSGLDSRAWLAGRLPADTGQVLAMLQLAQAVGQALVPVQIGSQYRSELRRSLLETTPALEADMRRPDRHVFYWAAAAAIGLALFALRKLIAGHTRKQTRVMTPAV